MNKTLSEINFFYSASCCRAGSRQTHRTVPSLDISVTQLATEWHGPARPHTNHVMMAALYLPVPPIPSHTEYQRKLSPDSGVFIASQVRAEK